MSNNTSTIKSNIGDIIQLQFRSGNKEQRAYVRLIGYVEGKSILATAPRIDGAAVRLQQDEIVVVRLISGNSAQGFTSRVIHSTSTPYPHLHIAFPSELESIEVKRSQRIQCSEIVSIKHGGDDAAPGVLTEISFEGAAFTSDDKLYYINDDISINVKFLVAGVELFLSLDAKITKTQVEDNNETTYIVKFQSLEDIHKLALHGYIYERLLNL